MTAFKDFPNDSVMRVIVWFDRITRSTQGTTSLTISVCLHTLHGSRTGEEVLACSAAENLTLLSGEPPPGFTVATVILLITDLPLLHIGDVYQGRQLIGRLQCERRTMQVTTRDDGFMGAIDAMPRVGNARHIYGDATSSHLAPHEYRIGSLLFMPSRLWIATSHGCTYLIPRAELLRRFYALNSQWISTIFSGQWTNVWTRLIPAADDQAVVPAGSKHATKAGQRALRVTLRANDPEWLAVPAALLTCTPWGVAATATIHPALQVDFGRIPGPAAYAAARCPVDSSVGEPTSMEVAGWTVTIGARPRFLVTRILSCQPTSFPAVLYDREDDTTTPGASQPATPPSATIQAAIPDVAITSASDGDPRLGRTELISDDGPLYRVTPPLRVKRTEPIERDRGGPPPAVATPPTGSTGTTSGNLPGVGRVVASAQGIQEDITFPHLMEILSRIREVTARPVAAPVGLGATLGTLPCWRFQPPTDRQTNGWWSLARSAQTRGEVPRRYPRCALLVKISSSATNWAYWLEIQSRPSESYHALLLRDVRRPLPEVMAKTLRLLTEARGHVRSSFFDRRAIPALIQPIMHGPRETGTPYTEARIRSALRKAEFPV